MQVAHINTNGITKIAAALGQFHKLGQDHFTAAMLHAWAAEAEQSFDNGNGMAFEIKSWDSITGHTEIVTIDSEGYDIEAVDLFAELSPSQVVSISTDSILSAMGSDKLAASEFEHLNPAEADFIKFCRPVGFSFFAKAAKASH